MDPPCAQLDRNKRRGEAYSFAVMQPPLQQNDPFGLCGQVLAQKYEVHELFAEGGFSLVYRGMHRIWKRPIAIKVLRTRGAAAEVASAMRETFLREGGFLAELSSRSTAIVQAWDVGTHTTTEGEWLPYMVLEWLDGEPLEQVLIREAGRPWSLAQAMQLLGPVAHALQLAHERGIAHRDIKPDNLFVVGRAPGEPGTVKILDFGVAKVMESGAVRAALATTGGTVRSFTPAYGAPEQFSPSYGATGPWTDVYALALSMVELLTGRPPLGGSEIVELAKSSMDPVNRPTPLARGALVSRNVDEVFLRALAVSPGARYANAGEFWSALENAVSGEQMEEASRLASSQPSTVPVELSAQKPRRGLIWAALGVGALVGLGVGGVLLLSANNRERSVLEGARLDQSPVVLGVAAKFRCPEGMARIPGGQFYQGSDADDAMATEKPAHQVKLPAFCIDLTEVTTRAYQACSDGGGCKRASSFVRWPNITEAQKASYGPLCNVGDPSRADHPINCVDWSMASTYCKAAGGRLPTEAEWEYATRGPDGRVYPWGDEDPTPKHLNACGSECVEWGKTHDESLSALFSGNDGFANTAPVGRYPAGRSRFGPLDVVGNVWEWVADWHGPYNAAEKTRPTGPATGERRVIRGGAWNGSEKSWLRPSFRYAQDPTALSHGIGFRCVMELPH
jgi:eukaryotic-like serine/threonine-protein kinase